MLISKKKQNGFSMIEVLVSLLVIGIGLLGLSGLQIASVKGTNNAHSRNVATMLGMEIGERMRANPAGVIGGFYDSNVSNVSCTTAETQCRGTVACTPQQIARADLQEVMCGVRRNTTGNVREGGAALLLPNGTFNITCNGACSDVLAEHIISMTWSTAKLVDAQDDSDLTQSITIAVTP